MKLFRFTALLGIFIIISLSSFSQGVERLLGNWLGTLKVQSLELRVVLKIIKNEKDSVIATLDSPDQGAKDIKVSEIRLSGDSVFIRLMSIKASFAGVIKDKLIEGIWKQASGSLPLNFEKTDLAGEYKRPQEPVPPFPYKIEKVYFENREDGIKLAGTLTLPESSVTSPAVILISGSGPQDRDEFILGHKPFMVLADYLTREGIAVLRYDDRGVGESEGKFSEATTRDFAIDAMAALQFMKNHKAIDSRYIGLVGHSEGGLIAPMVASKSDDVAFIIILAGPGLTGEEILGLQTELIARAEGEKEEDIQEALKVSKKIWRIAGKNYKYDKAVKKIQEVYKEYLATLSEEEKQSAGLTSAAITAGIQQVLSPWFKYFLTYDPAPALEKVKCPVLALYGEKDLQVPPKQNIAAVRKALIKGGNKIFIVEEIESLNHLFQYSLTGLPSEYSKIDETFNIKALEIIKGWIKTQLRNK
jgi:pimeloyl-ACP methyl ester carboxylesterase